MKLTHFILLVGILLILAACATPAQTAAAGAAIAETATALFNSLAPLLPPETLAKVQASAAHIDGTVRATATALGTLADAVAQSNANAGAQIHAVVDSVSKLSHDIASLPTQTQTTLMASGSAAIGTAASRYMSYLKHGGYTAAEPKVA